MKKYIKMTLCSVVLTLVWPLVSMANINSDLTGFFNSLGNSTNITNPQAYQGQQGGYYTGGSLFTRSSVRDVQLLGVELPSINAGCGGIDLFTGGFSFINSQQLESAMKNVANNAVNYAFMLALKTVSPLISNTMNTLQDWANGVNKMNINSCETAASLVGGLWPKTQVAQENVCQTIGAHTGMFDDFAAARQGCGTGGQADSVLSSGEKNPQFKDMVMNHTNIAWKAIQKSDFLVSDQELAELFMSLSGTIVIDHKSSDSSASAGFYPYPSIITNQDTIKALINGGKLNIYVCDNTDKCLNPRQQQTTIDANSALGAQVKKLLTDMVSRIQSDTPLTKEEIALLESTPLPVYKMLNVEVAYSGGDVLDLSQYSDVIAIDLLYQYISETLKIVESNSASLQYPEDILEKFLKGINEARINLLNTQETSYKRMNSTLALIERTQVLEKQLAGDLSEQLSGNLSWANGMKG